LRLEALQSRPRSLLEQVTLVPSESSVRNTSQRGAVQGSAGGASTATTWSPSISSKSWGLAV
jgi:hypothetical protein